MTTPFLNDVTILDLTNLFPGPYATSLLADLGADVIKIEHPDGGDLVRAREPKADDLSYTIISRNRTKQSLTLNLKDDRGRQTFLDLTKDADVVIESFRPGVVDRLGVSYDDVKPVNDDIIYCSISGYGQSGPYADRPGHDINYISVAGLLGLTGTETGPPIPPGYLVADCVSGLVAGFAISAAIAGVRNGTGGDYIDVSMTDAIVSFATAYLGRYIGRNEIPKRGQTTFTGRHPGYWVYQTKDGGYVSVGSIEKHFWDNLCDALDTPTFKKHHRDPNTQLPAKLRNDITNTFAARIGQLPRDEVLALFDDHDVPAAPVYDFDELFDDPHLQARGIFDSVTVDTPDGPEEIMQLDIPMQFRTDRKQPKAPVSHLGEDSIAILESLGYDDDTIAEYLADVVITDKQPL